MVAGGSSPLSSVMFRHIPERYPDHDLRRLAELKPRLGQTGAVKVALVAVLIALVIVSVPSFRRRYLGKYAAFVLAGVWLFGMAFVILT